MDPGQSEYYEFLDLTDIDENERSQLNNTLFPSEQSSHDLTDSGVWNEGTFESDHLSALNSGSSVPPSESDFSMNGDHHHTVAAVAGVSMSSPQFGSSGGGAQCPPGVPQSTAAATAMYGAPSYSMHQGSPLPHMYHPHHHMMQQPAPLSNVYVGNVTANVNVHGYLGGGHYIPYMTPAPVEQAPEIPPQRPMHNRDYNPRGRRGRGGHNKREYQSPRSQHQQQQQMQHELVEAHQQQQQAAYQQYMSMPFQSTYYQGVPQSHLAQHATGSPLYVGQHMPMYTPMPHLYQYHPGMLYSPMGIPPEYQMMEPTGKMDGSDIDMYGHPVDMTHQMMSMNLQGGDDIYNCMPPNVTHPVMNEYVMPNNGVVLEECPQDGILEPTPFMEMEKVMESVPIVTAIEAVPSVVAPLTNYDMEPVSVIPVPDFSAVDQPTTNVVERTDCEGQPNMIAPEVSTPLPKQECIKDELLIQPTQMQVQKTKGPFVNNKDIVKTGPGRKSSLKLSSQLPKVLQQTTENQIEVPVLPQPQEVQKLQSDSKIGDHRPKSQTPPNSVWVNNQLYTPPANDLPENAILVQNLPSKVHQKPKSPETNELVQKSKEIPNNAETITSVPVNINAVAIARSTLPATVTAAPPASKSWASLFNNKSNDILTSIPIVSTVQVNNGPPAMPPSNSVAKPMAMVQPLETANTISAPIVSVNNGTAKVENLEKDQTGPVNSGQTFLDDPNSYRAGEFLQKYNLDNRTVSLQPRGLTNRSNYCYINSTLQALMACPPLYNLLKALPYQVKRGKSSTPVIDAMVQLAHEFSPLPAGARVGRREKGQQRRDDLPDVSTGPAFEPLVIHRMLNGIHPNTFQVEGRQEDAEEFLGCLLNGLNDEMVELMKLVGEPEEKSEIANGNITNGNLHVPEDDDEWKVMGPKNKGSITRRSYFCRSPISDIFRGQLRSRVQRAGDLTTDSVQPFFTLQLDIEKAASVMNALELLVGRDQLEGVTCSKTNQEVEAWQQVSLEELPVVLILHLKWFDYKLDGCTKIVKNVEFPIDLKIDAKIMSSKIKYTVKQRQYKLFAVVYHDGKEASKGHYITDVFHVGFNGWIRYDDSVVKAVTENMVLHPRQPRVPYLLYYRRCDTIGMPGNANSRNH